MKIYAGIILENKRGQVLLMLRDDLPNIANPNTWSIIGGTAKPNESATKALRREVMEEIGYKLSTYNLFFQESNNKGDKERYIFKARIDKKLSELRLGDEGQDLKFYSLNEALKLNLGPFTKKYLTLLKSLRKVN